MVYSSVWFVILLTQKLPDQRKHKWRENLPSKAISGITVLRLSSSASCSRDYGPQYPHKPTSIMITKEDWKTQIGK